MHPPDVYGPTDARRVLGARAVAHSRRGPVAAVAGAVSAGRLRLVLPQDAAWHRRPGEFERDGLRLLCVGISPGSAADGSPQSQQNLYQRVRYHYTGNAEGSTLRLTLGCRLASELNALLKYVLVLS